MTSFLRYEAGQPRLKNIWVDPLHGQDDAAGSARSTALRTLRAAWERIPAFTEPDRAGWRILLAPGRYPPEPDPQAIYQNRYGTRDCPIVLQPADGPRTAVLSSTWFRNCRHLHLLDVKVLADEPRGRHSTLSFHRCDYVLVRGVATKAVGRMAELERRENLKAHLCKHLYVEDSEFDGAWDNALDYGAVHYGHIIRCRIHNALHEVMYVKGGCGYLRIEDNEVYDGVNHGIMAGQCTGFEYMQPPWIHYEAYGIRVVNNFIHDAGGGLAVAGGYNILMAHNTCYRVGSDRDLVLVGLGDNVTTPGREAACRANYLAGGWSDPTGRRLFNIPNRNVFIYNNVFLNPDGFRSGVAHMGISGPVRTPRRSHIPSPARADDNLRIRGNVVWNGGDDMPLFDPIAGLYHLAAKCTCSPSIILRHNTINTIRPVLADPEHGDGRPVKEGDLLKVRSHAIPDFAWDDAPPGVPAGECDNAVTRDRSGARRRASGVPGAWA
jgi:hypothetical protein